MKRSLAGPVKRRRLPVKRVLLFLIGLWGTVLSLPAESIEPFVMPSARFGALGGNHAALADDYYTIFTNPAGLVGIEEVWNLAEITVDVYGPVFELLNLISQPMDSLESLDVTGILGPGGFAMGMDIGGPIAWGWAGRGLGIGIFNRTKADATLAGTHLRPKVSEDILLLGGYSFRLLDRIGHTLDTGFLGKGFFRGSLNLDTSIFTAMDMFKDPLKQPLTTYLGLGFDLGFRYTFAESLSAALVCYDLYSPALVTVYNSFDDFTNRVKPDKAGSYTEVTRRLALGLAYKIRNPFLDRYISNWMVMADYRDFLNLFAPIPRNPILNIGIGMEVLLLNILTLRIGIADALPCAGFGLDLTYFKLDCSIHGKELGLDPGLQSTYALDLALLFRY
jgi:hypothetical protein